MTFSALLSAIGIAPKTLPQASETLAAARGQLDSVAALFTAAGLNLETMLAAGPESLKAHLTSLDNSTEVTRLTGEVETLTAEITAANGRLDVSGKTILAHEKLFAAVGLNGAATADSEAFTKQFNEHIAKSTTLALAKTGHPPAHVPAAVAPDAIAATPEAIYAEYAKMETGELKQAFYAKHEAAIWAGKRALDAKK